ncbi:hypothetical protein V5N11_000846 [Cardamine amara subsp. amara]|uniref:Uncharacterized protein n=1 Tax=Cardamine amara subsp. amara TaxID=228776 RepID=A0ABD0Z5W4_CARAN
MDAIFEEITSKVNTTKTSVDYSHTAYIEATNSYFVDETFEVVTKPIISQMHQISIIARNVAYRLQILRNVNNDPNFLRDLNTVSDMAVGALANSKTVEDQMLKAIDDAKERNKTRKGKEKVEEE